MVIRVRRARGGGVANGLRGPGGGGLSRAATARRWAGRLVADVTPLRNRDFRRLWLGESISTLGTQMTLVAVSVQVYTQTHSSFAVGLVSLAVVIPLIVFGLVGGSIADAVDRRRMTLLTSGGLSLLSVVLVVQSSWHSRPLWLLYSVMASSAALGALDSPARATFAPRLVSAEAMPAVGALRQIAFSSAMTFGPLLAGILIAARGPGLVYAIDVASFGAILYASSRLPTMKPESGGTRAGLSSVLDGFRFLRTQPVVLMTFAVDLNAMIFGMPRALFPALALSQFHGGPRTVGLLYAAPAIGALFGALFSGPLGRVRRQGWGVLWSIAVWGLAVAVFGFVHSLWLGVVLLGIAGLADMISAVFRSAMLYAVTPDHMRGRLSGVFLVVVAGGPRVGDLEAGGVAALTSTEFSVVSGGLACVVGVALLGALVPSFRNHDATATSQASERAAGSHPPELGPPVLPPPVLPVDPAALTPGGSPDLP